MIRIAFTFCIICFLAACTGNPSSPEVKDTKQTETNKEAHQRVDAEQFAQMLAAAEDPQLIDVRRPQEYAQGYIPGSKLIDYHGADFYKKMMDLDTGQTVFVYCAAGGRSQKTAERMVQSGFKKVIELEGGYTEWEEYEQAKKGE